MIGINVTYKPKDKHSRTILNHKLFGRLLYRNSHNVRYAFYVQGFLDNIRYARLMDGKIFIDGTDNLNVTALGELSPLGEIKIEETEIDETTIKLETAKQHWYFLARQKGLIIRERRRKLSR